MGVWSVLIPLSHPAVPPLSSPRLPIFLLARRAAASGVGVIPDWMLIKDSR